MSVLIPSGYNSKHLSRLEIHQTQFIAGREGRRHPLGIHAAQAHRFAVFAYKLRRLSMEPRSISRHIGGRERIFLTEVCRRNAPFDSLPRTSTSPNNSGIDEKVLKRQSSPFSSTETIRPSSKTCKSPWWRRNTPGCDRARLLNKFSPTVLII